METILGAKEKGCARGVGGGGRTISNKGRGGIQEVNPTTATGASEDAERILER